MWAFYNVVSYLDLQLGHLSVSPHENYNLFYGQTLRVC